MFNCLFTQVSKAVTHLDVYCAKVLCHPLFLYIVLGKWGERCSTLLKNLQAYMKILYIYKSEIDNSNDQPQLS